MTCPADDECTDQTPCAVCPHCGHADAAQEASAPIRMGGPGGTTKVHPLVCSVEGCEKPNRSGNAVCPMHLARMKRHGSYDGRTATDRLMAKVAVGAEGDCWLWTGSKDKGNYGKAPDGGPAHKAAYELLIGPVPAGAHLDHICHTNDLGCPGGDICQHRLCVNPAHLEPVTPAENTRRAAARKVACPQGHPYPVAGGRRQCLICRRASSRRYEDKKRQARAG